MPLLFFIVGYWVSMTIINAIPIVGQIAGFILIQAFSVSLFNVCKLIAQGQPLPPQLLFSGFHRNLQALLVLGVLALIAVFVAFSISTFVLSSALSGATFVPGGSANTELISGGQLLIILLVVLFLFIPLVMSFWYAPILVAWHDFSVGKSLFFSLVACARNWRAISTYFLAILVVSGLVRGFVATLILPFINAAVADRETYILFTTSLIIMPTLYAASYVSYRDVFVSLRDEA